MCPVQLSPLEVCMLHVAVAFPAAQQKRHRGDSNPCGQSPMDFESISLTARTQCHGTFLSGCTTHGANRTPRTTPQHKHCTAIKLVPRGLEPRTLRLLAVRSNQLSYETRCVSHCSSLVGFQDAGVSRIGFNECYIRSESLRSLQDILIP